MPPPAASCWRANAGAPLAAGVGSDGRFAAVVTRDNELVVFEAGNELWRKRLTSRVTTAPLVAGERVFVMGVDRVVARVRRARRPPAVDACSAPAMR